MVEVLLNLLSFIYDLAYDVSGECPMYSWEDGYYGFAEQCSSLFFYVYLHYSVIQVFYSLFDLLPSHFISNWKQGIDYLSLLNYFRL